MPMGERNLADVMSTERLAGGCPIEVRNILLQVGEALSYMHERAGRVHGDLNPKNVMRYEERYHLIDLDASEDIGEAYGEKYSEAYLPPERWQRILPTMVDRLSRVTSGQRLQAAITHDVWQFGVVMYEICSGQDLFLKDQDDKIVNDADRESLSGWETLDHKQLEPIFLQSEHSGKCTATRRLLAQDCIAVCLRGHQRPASMKEVLSHPFFTKSDEELKTFLPVVPYHGNGLDVIISYQTTQVLDMGRMRRCLNIMGITTADGTQVPPGGDWRGWYFERMESASAFLPVISENYMNSGACYEEASRAFSINLPTVVAVHDADGWARCSLANAQNRERREKYDEMFSTGRDNVHTVPNQGDFMTDFWSNLIETTKRIIQYLPKGHVVLVVVLCATPDRAWTSDVCQKLSIDDVKAVVCETEEEWARLTHENPNNGFIISPVLTQESLYSPVTFKIMSEAHKRRISVLPILKDHKGHIKALWSFKKKSSSIDSSLQTPTLINGLTSIDSSLPSRIPFLNSILNRANRVPANSDWDKNPSRNLLLLSQALREIAGKCRNDEIMT